MLVPKLVLQLSNVTIERSHISQNDRNMYWQWAFDVVPIFIIIRRKRDITSRNRVYRLLRIQTQFSLI